MFTLKRPHPRIAIIGGGFGGIAVSVLLKKAGITSFTILEKSDDIGGVWWDNRYPGAEVDTPSVMYSYSFEPWRWSRTHVRQSELLEYIHHVADKHGLNSHVRTRTEVRRVDWSDSAQLYTVTFADGSTEKFEIVISGVGLLSDPRYPTWPGLDSFEGAKFHTSRWDHSVDLSDKTVAVVGTGSTSAQVVPNVAVLAKKVVMFQREPGWVLPKGAKTFTQRERDALNDPIAQKIVRWGMLIRREKAQRNNAAWRPGTPQNTAAEKAARAYIAEVFADRPDLAEIVTPKYPFGGKRPVLTDDFYPSLCRENVSVVPHAVESVTPDGLIDVTGATHKIDVLVMATGFKSSFASTFDATGEGGVDLHSTWNGDATALVGVMTPSFPNFFMLYGPNTNGGAIVTHLEAQAKYIVSAIKHIIRWNLSSLTVDKSITEKYNDVIQKRLSGASFDGANNYYTSASGRIITQWSDGALAYNLATRVLRHVAWHGRRIVPTTSKPLVVIPVDEDAPTPVTDADLENLLSQGK